MKAPKILKNAADQKESNSINSNCQGIDISKKSNKKQRLNGISSNSFSLAFNAYYQLYADSID